MCTQPVEAYANVVPLEDKAQGSVTFRTYYKYFIAGGGYIVNLILFVVFLMTEVRGVIVACSWVCEVRLLPAVCPVLCSPGEYCGV